MQFEIPVTQELIDRVKHDGNCRHEVHFPCLTEVALAEAFTATPHLSGKRWHVFADIAASEGEEGRIDENGLKLARLYDAHKFFALKPGTFTYTTKDE